MGLLEWWYGAGLVRQLRSYQQAIIGAYDYFSIDLLVRSWFAPFRQIAAGGVRGSLAMQWRAFVDRTVSRFIGAFMRTVLIVIGLIAIAITGVGCVLLTILWLAAPFLPVVGAVLAVVGVHVWSL